MPKETVPFLRAHLKPAGPDQVQRILTLIRVLDDDEFRKREGAMKELRIVGCEAQQFLRVALEKTRSADCEKRIKDLLADPKLREWEPETIRSLRAIRDRVETAAGPGMSAMPPKAKVSYPARRNRNDADARDRSH